MQPPERHLGVVGSKLPAPRHPERRGPVHLAEARPIPARIHRAACPTTDLPWAAGDQNQAAAEGHPVGQDPRRRATVQARSILVGLTELLARAVPNHRVRHLARRAEAAAIPGPAVVVRVRPWDRTRDPALSVGSAFGPMGAPGQPPPSFLQFITGSLL